MLEKGLIREITSSGEKKLALTDKGFRFLDKYRVIVDFIDEFEL
jgi:predicted transcriptional regulator